MLKNFLIIILLGSISSVVYASAVEGIDPTRPANLQNQSAYHLEQVVYSLTKKNVVINGEVLSIGENLGDMTVKDITPNGVELTGPNGLTTLIFVDDIKKNPTKSTE